MSLSENIRNKREELKLSQEYVADQLGISRQAVSKWETGQSEPTASNLMELATLFEISLSELVDPQKYAEEQEALKMRYGKKQPNKKKKIKIIIAVIVCLLLAGAVGSVAYIRNLPVDWDAGACGGGYATFIFDKYSEELVEKYLDGMADNSSITSIEAIRGTQEAQWEDQTIFLQFDVQYEHPTQGTVTERLRFTGQRTWFDTYDWSGAIIEG